MLIKSQLFPLDAVLDQTPLNLPLCVCVHKYAFPFVLQNKLLTEKCLY